MLVFVKIFFEKGRFFGFCNTLPAGALPRLFRLLLMLATEEVRTKVKCRCSDYKFEWK